MNTEPGLLSSVPAAAPVAENRRIVLLDALRGLAILGIAVVNVQFFACPLLRLLSWRWDQVPPSEAIVRATITIFAEHHFFSIFAVLFGMGLALQYRRMRETGESFGGLYFRRLVVLLGFGITHALLLWYGDILALYALVGIVVYWFRDASPRTLLRWAIVIFMVPVAIQTGLMLLDPTQPGKSVLETKEELVASLRIEGESPPATQDAAEHEPPAETPATQSAADRARARRAIAFSNLFIRFLNWLADDAAIYRSGSYGDMMLHRLVCFLLFSPGVAIEQMGWRALALMLFGIYLVRRGLFCTSGYSNAVYRRLALLGLTVGLPLQIAGILVHARGPDLAWSAALSFNCIYLGSMGMTLAYMGIVYLLYQNGVWRTRLQPLAAVGRMSLTNYIGTSFLFGLIFYGYGLGLMDEVTFWQAELLTAGVLIILMVFSVLWLKLFRIGPLEWLWRTLTYLRFVPLFRRNG